MQKDKQNQGAFAVFCRLGKASPAIAAILYCSSSIAADSTVQAERTLGQQYMSVLPALVMILLLIVGLAFLVRKYNPTLGRGNPLMRVLGTMPLGGKERLILVEAGDACLLLGVTPGQIQTLHLVNKDSLGGQLDELPGTAGAGFANILQAVIKR